MLALFCRTRYPVSVLPIGIPVSACASITIMNRRAVFPPIVPWLFPASSTPFPLDGTTA